MPFGFIAGRGACSQQSGPLLRHRRNGCGARALLGSTWRKLGGFQLSPCRRPTGAASREAARRADPAAPGARPAAPAPRSAIRGTGPHWRPPRAARHHSQQEVQLGREAASQRPSAWSVGVFSSAPQPRIGWRVRGWHRRTTAPDRCDPRHRASVAGAQACGRWSRLGSSGCAGRGPTSTCRISRAVPSTGRPCAGSRRSR